MRIDRSVSEGFENLPYTEQMKHLDTLRFIYKGVFDAALDDLDSESHAFSLYGDIICLMSDIALKYEFDMPKGTENPDIKIQVETLALEMGNYSEQLLLSYKRKMKSRSMKKESGE
ncbi:MAG: hypothetical protein ABIF08_04770 [Nanoarchaeota archaeon]